MPPKKKNATKQAEAADVTPPDTVTSKRGKEYATSAAAARPRRASAAVEGPAPAKAKPKTSATSAKATPKKRGRPAKPDSEDEEDDEAAAPPKKRGRPPKASVNKTTKNDEESDVEATAPKKRGRPPKAAPAAKKSPAPAVPEDEGPPPKKRGRPPKGGETTKIAADDEAAADQLEGELEEAASKFKGKAKAKGKTATDQEVDDDEINFWLMKAEQEDRFETVKDGSQINTKFTIDDLRSKDEPEPWDGVRNPVAAKNMKTMRKGDLAFFYASGGKSGRAPGITGIMEVVSEAEQDPTVYDESAYGYVEKEADRKKWVIVKVEFRKKLSKPVALKQLQKFAQSSGVLEDMQLLKQTRLSVSHVNQKHWDFIVDNLIEGYDDDEQDEPASNGVSVQVET